MANNPSVTYIDFSEGEVFEAPPPRTSDRSSGEAFSEFPSLRVEQPQVPTPTGNPNITIEFDQKDLTTGTARYRSARKVDQNLSMQGPNPMPHTSIEVRFTGKNGQLVPMTRRLVRTWDIQPLSSESRVDNLRGWRITGLHHSEFLPFSPVPLSAREVPPRGFEWDRPGQKDAPGFLGVRENLGFGTGTLQEFIAGNEAVGGVYYQVYCLADRNGTRVFSTDAFAFDPKAYGTLLKMLNDPKFRGENLHKLLFMPRVPEGRDKSSSYPKTPQLAPRHGAKLRQ